jgi:hypothetical protein
MMPEKESMADPMAYPLITYVWVFVWSAFGGIVSFIQKVKAGHARVFNLAEFVGELCTSAFVGLLTFWLCQSQGISPLNTAIAVSISGHMGTRALFMLEKNLERRVFSKTPDKDAQP